MYYIGRIRDTLVLGQKIPMIHLQVLNYIHRYLSRNVYVVRLHLHGSGGGNIVELRIFRGGDSLAGS